MRWLAILGVVLVLLGIAGLVVRSIPYHETEQVAKIGPVTATQVSEKEIMIPPYVSVIVIVAGLGLVYLGRGKT